MIHTNNIYHTGSAASNITSLYQKPQNQNVFGQGNGFGYQGNPTVTAYDIDPFAGIGKNPSQVQPAGYVTRKKQEDPFAQFQMK